MAAECARPRSGTSGGRSAAAATGACQLPAAPNVPQANGLRCNETVLVDIGANLGWCAWPPVAACAELASAAAPAFASSCSLALLPHTLLLCLHRYTLQAAAAGYQVIAFEPLPQNVGAIRRSLCANPHLAALVTLIPKGAVEACGGSCCKCISGCLAAAMTPQAWLCLASREHSCAPCRAGLSSKADRCKFIVYNANLGNGVVVCSSSSG